MRRFKTLEAKQAATEARLTQKNEIIAKLLEEVLGMVGLTTHAQEDARQSAVVQVILESALDIPG